MTRVVVGLDPSLTGTGIAVVAGPGFIQTTTVTSSGKRGASLQARVDRLRKLKAAVLEWVPEGSLVVVEGPAYSKGNAGTWDRAWFWGSLVSALAEHEGTDVVLCPPNIRAMYATGRGNAGKADVAMAVAKRFPQVDLHGDNETDALAMAAMGRRLIGEPIDNPPQTHTRAMKSLELPEALSHAMA